MQECICDKKRKEKKMSMASTVRACPGEALEYTMCHAEYCQNPTNYPCKCPLCIPRQGITLHDPKHISCMLLVQSRVLEPPKTEQKANGPTWYGTCCISCAILSSRTRAGPLDRIKLSQHRREVKLHLVRDGLKKLPGGGAAVALAAIWKTPGGPCR